MAAPVTLLDTILPLHDAREVHERLLPGEPAAVWDALHATRMSEIRAAGVLMGIRSLPGRLTGAKAARRGADLPALQALLAGGFVKLGEDAPRETVIGAVGQFWRLTANKPLPLKDRVEFMQFTQPGYVRVAMSFRLVPEVGGTRLITETRVLGTDPASARAFRRYWLLIRLGSGAIRRSWLAAVARRLAA
jgi:hypothetical protein